MHPLAETLAYAREFGVAGDPEASILAAGRGGSGLAGRAVTWPQVVSRAGGGYVSGP